MEKAVALFETKYEVSKNAAYNMYKELGLSYNKPMPMSTHRASLIRPLIWTFHKKRVGRPAQMKSVTTANTASLSACLKRRSCALRFSDYLQHHSQTLSQR